MRVISFVRANDRGQGRVTGGTPFDGETVYVVDPVTLFSLQLKPAPRSMSMTLKPISRSRTNLYL